MDTIVVPARKRTFEEWFLKQSCWEAIPIKRSMFGKIKYIAVYQTAPVSAITHYAKVKKKGIVQSNTVMGKYAVHFEGKAKKISPVRRVKNGRVWAVRHPMYASLEKLKRAKNLDAAF